MAKANNVKYKFNLVDFLIVVALIFAISALIYVALGNDILELTEEHTAIDFVLSADAMYADSWLVNDQIYTKKGKSAGVITSTLLDDSGRIVLVISSEAYEADGDLFIKGQTLALGQSFSISLGDEVIDAKCERIVTDRKVKNVYR